MATKKKSEPCVVELSPDAQGEVEPKDSAPDARIGVAGARVVTHDASRLPLIVTDAPPRNAHLVITDVIFSANASQHVHIIEESTLKILLELRVQAGGMTHFKPAGVLRLTKGRRLMVQTTEPGTLAVTTLYYVEAQES